MMTRMRGQVKLAVLTVALEMRTTQCLTNMTRMAMVKSLGRSSRIMSLLSTKKQVLKKCRFGYKFHKLKK